jgi:hypothetical protein
MEKYELLKDIGAGNFGVARLMRNKETKELVAMKYIPRGQKVRRSGLVEPSTDELPRRVRVRSRAFADM